MTFLFWESRHSPVPNYIHYAHADYINYSSISDEQAAGTLNKYANIIYTITRLLSGIGRTWHFIEEKPTVSVGCSDISVRRDLAKKLLPFLFVCECVYLSTHARLPQLILMSQVHLMRVRQKLNERSKNMLM